MGRKESNQTKQTCREFSWVEPVQSKLYVNVLLGILSTVMDNCSTWIIIRERKISKKEICYQIGDQTHDPSLRAVQNTSTQSA